MADKDITGLELARRCGVSQSKMSFVINNKQSARLELIYKIQDVLGIEDDEFAYYFLVSGGGQVS